MKAFVLFASLLAIMTAIDNGSSRTKTTAESQPEIAQVIKEFMNYRKMTDQEFPVNSINAASCMTPSQVQIKRAIEKHGPHANHSVLIYMNKLAADAYEKKTIPFPVGAIIVKKKMIGKYIGDDRNLPGAENGVGGMIKRKAGFDPDHNDWEYFYYEDPNKVEQGAISSQSD